jgi:uncharacterized hydrophobic protein (TIGR00271 family)
MILLRPGGGSMSDTGNARHRSFAKAFTMTRRVGLEWRRLARSVDHDAVIHSVDQEGSLRASDLFMCVMASGIATTGLMLNSPAVIIGAMLISPLMAPIMRLGLGIGTLDHVRVRDALVVLAAGIAFALATAATIAWLSPIHEITPEIAARTRPSLFDLVVAVLSGLAGGYAMVRGRGGAIVGVAIATALMPPMSVVGYGLASSEWAIARGASLLFVTNLVAIALSVTAISTWYGFSRRRVRHALVWQTALLMLIVLPLALPLLQSLRAIAYEAAVAGSIRSAVGAVLGANDSRVLSLQVSRRDAGGPSRVDLTLASRHYTQQDDRRLRAAIQRAVNGKVDLRLTPIVEADPRQAALLEEALARAEAPVPKPVEPPAQPSPAELLLANLPAAVSGREIDEGAHSLRVQLADASLGLEAARKMESAMRAHLPGWSVSVVPAPQALPVLSFASGSAQLDADALATLQSIEWALRAWRISDVEVIGQASGTGRGNARLALARGQSVAAQLESDGFSASATGTLPASHGPASEAELGRLSFQTARVVPATAHAAR